MAPKTNTLAIVSAVLGLLCIPIMFPFGPAVGAAVSLATLVAGFVARSQIRAHKPRPGGYMLAVGGIIFGVTGLSIAGLVWVNMLLATA